MPGELFGWGTFLEPEHLLAILIRPLFWVFGTLLTVLAVRRLLIPGCRPLVRINFGGIHDIRLSTVQLRWSLITQARRPPGFLKYLLRGVVLQLHPDYEPAGSETLWSRLFHFTCRLRGKHILFVECGSLDQKPDTVLAAIQSHLQSRRKMGLR
ncbi:MAG: hypothetical protein H7834_13090 [Magnetococcus sp. YQC-9]